MLMKMSWLFPAIFSMILWGVWGLFQKLATNQMPPRNVYFFATAGALCVVCSMLAATSFPLSVTNKGILFAVLAGASSSLGGLLFLTAISRGKASIVIPFTALYPVITIILSFTILKETITLKQGIGIVLALLSMVLMV
jgi:bacterial/archaeal transporter family protein